jgi:pimeloyl-ACP methyl ester carboxylesterase
MPLKIDELFGDYKGNRFRYLSANTGKKKVAVLMHGYSFYADVWAKTGTMQSFADSGYSVISLDMPGYPNSKSRFVLTDEGYLGFIDYVIKEFGGHKPLLLGSSLSGYLALRYASSHSESISALIVVGPVRIDTVKLEDVKVPTLGIWGSDDELNMPDKSGFLKSRIRNSEAKKLPGAKHACYLDDPVKFNDIISIFLSKHG